MHTSNDEGAVYSGELGGERIILLRVFRCVVPNLLTLYGLGLVLPDVNKLVSREDSATGSYPISLVRKTEITTLERILRISHLGRVSRASLRMLGLWITRLESSER